jgi:predicted RNA-binding protein YlxR (DUF448 family)
MGSGAGVERETRTPVRTCVVTRTKHPPDELIRFVLGPDGLMVPDLANQLPGRGVWVCCDRQAVSAAVRLKAFSRSLRRQADASADLTNLVERLMVRRALDALSLANKAGLVVAGFTRVEAAVSTGEATLLMHGAEAADDGVDKLDRKFRAVARELGRPAPIIRVLTIEQLSLAIGRANVVHAALRNGGATANFLKEATRLTRYRSDWVRSSGDRLAS